MASPYGRPPRSAHKHPGQSHSGSPTRYGACSTGSQSSSLGSNSSFQMMNLSISVDIMEGLTMECNKIKGEGPLGSMPVNAFISCMKNVSKSRQIATHVPSLPLSIPAANFGDKLHNFLVRWPADFDPEGDALSTFKLSRLMKKDAYYSDYDISASASSGYVPEEIELFIGLMRGSEMIKLGKANLVISGNESSEMLIDLPVIPDMDTGTNKTRDASPVPLKRSSSKLFGRKKDGTSSKKSAPKPRSFPSDSRRKYHFSEHSMIRLQVQLVPESGEEMAQNPCSFDEYEVVKDKNLHPPQPDPSKTASITMTSSASASRSHPHATGFSSSFSISTEELSANVDSNDFISLTSTLQSTSEDDYHYDQHYHSYNPNHKRNHRVPMDEMQHDMGNIRLTSDRRPKPQRSHGAYQNQQPSLTTSSSRPSSRSRGYVPDAHDYSIQQSPLKTSRSNVRPSSRSRGHRAFGQEMPSLTQHAYVIPASRSSTPKKSRDSASPGFKSPQSNSKRNSSRSKPRDHDYYHGNHEIRQNEYGMTNSPNHRDKYVPVASSHLDQSFEHNDEDGENLQFYANEHHQEKQRRRRHRVPKGPSDSTPRGGYLNSAHSNEQRHDGAENHQYYVNERRSTEKKSHRKKRDDDGTTDQVASSKSEESPMTWIYDKLVGKNQSHDETVVKNNKSKSSSSSSSKKKVRNSGEHSRSKDGHCTLSTPKRTMKV